MDNLQFDVDAPVFEQLPAIRPTWNAERDEILRDMWASGCSAREIAAELGGVTRSAVIGRAHRIGLGKTIEEVKWSRTDEETLIELWAQNVRVVDIAMQIRRRGARSFITKQSVQKKAQKLGLPKRIIRANRDNTNKKRKERKPPKRLVTPVIDLQIPLEQRRSLLGLAKDQCRWPVGDPGDENFFFCGGQKQDGSSYCSAHHARAFDYRRPKGSGVDYARLKAA